LFARVSRQSLLIDLGLALDVAYANSLDRIDVQAKIPEGKDADEVIKTLEKFNIPISDKHKKKLKSHNTIQIQCKDYDHSHVDEDYIFFCSSAKNSKGKNVYNWDASMVIDLLKNDDAKNKFQNLNRWYENYIRYFAK